MQLELLVKKKVALVYCVTYENAANMKYASLHSLLSNMFGEEFKVTAKVSNRDVSYDGSSIARTVVRTSTTVYVGRNTHRPEKELPLQGQLTRKRLSLLRIPGLFPEGNFISRKDDDKSTDENEIFCQKARRCIQILCCWTKPVMAVKILMGSRRTQRKRLCRTPGFGSSSRRAPA